MVIIGHEAISLEDCLKSRIISPQGWRIAIPSYKRAETLRDKTLKVLADYGVPHEKIDVFVANEEEERIYHDTLTQGTYARIIRGVVGMGAIRNFMTDFYQQGQRIVFLDDDSTGFYMLDERGNSKDIPDLSSFFDYAFQVSSEVGAQTWGLYPADNTYFMKRRIAVGLKYIIGSFYGQIIDHAECLKVTMDDKEDFERSVRSYLRYGKVVRFEFIGNKTNYYNEGGGMQVERTEQRVELSGRKLIAMFPQQVRHNTRRKQHFEVELVEQREKYKDSSRRYINLL
jgi:hypothetical protein